MGGPAGSSSGARRARTIGSDGRATRADPLLPEPARYEARSLDGRSGTSTSALPGKEATSKL